jgi:hypothetical protein
VPKVAIFLLGTTAPFAAILILNQLLFGSITSTGYGNPVAYAATSYRATNLLIGAVVFAAIMGRRRIALLVRGRFGKPLAAVGILLIFAIVMSHQDYFLVPARLIISEVADFSLNARYQELPKKMALLQASPILILSVLGFIAAVKKDADKAVLTLFACMVAAQVLFIGGMVGGDGSLSFMRYLLESVPYLSILTGYMLVRAYAVIREGIGKDYRIYCYTFVAALILQAANNLAPNEFSYILYKVPLALAAGTLIFYWRDMRKTFDRTFQILVVALAAYSLSVNIAYIMDTVEHRDYYMGLSEALDERIPHNSLVVYSHYLNGVPLTPIKTKKDIRLGYLGLGNETTNNAIIDYHIQKGIPVYYLRGLSNRTELDKKIEARYGAREEVAYGDDYMLLKLGKT